MITKKQFFDIHWQLSDSFERFEYETLNEMQYINISMEIIELMKEKKRYDHIHAYLNAYNETINLHFPKIIEIADDIRSFRTRFSILFALKSPTALLDNELELFKINQFKSENDMETVIYNHIYGWFFDNPKFKIQRQLKTSYGRLDILVNYGSKKFLLELKKGKSRARDMFQVLEYEMDHENAELIVVAKSFDDMALAVAKKYKIHCLTYDAFEVDEKFDLKDGLYFEDKLGSFDKLIKKYSDELTGIMIGDIDYSLFIERDKSIEKINDFKTNLFKMKEYFDNEKTSQN